MFIRLAARDSVELENCLEFLADLGYWWQIYTGQLSSIAEESTKEALKIGCSFIAIYTHSKTIAPRHYPLTYNERVLTVKTLEELKFKLTLAELGVDALENNQF